MRDDMTPRRRFKRSTVTKAAIVRAAAELLATQGYEATSPEQVAAKVGMAKATIYYHFGSKEELYWAVLWPITLETVDHMEEIVTREAPARDLIIEVMRAAAVRARDPRQRYVYYQELVP